jgi:outer membrane protein TolC
MSWNISLGGKEMYSAQMAAAELHTRESKLEDQERITVQATDADMALLEAARIRIQAALSEEAAARSVVKAVDAQLKSGRINSLLEALDASERHFAARQRLLSAIGQQMKTHAQLLMRLGLLSAAADNTTGQ